MDEFQVEVETLEHNFWQLLNLTKRLLARNEVLKAKLNEQTQEFTWRLREMEKENEDFRRKNLLLQKKLTSYEGDDVSVVSKDYKEVLMATGNHSELQPSNQHLLEDSPNEFTRDFEETGRIHSESDTPREETESNHDHLEHIQAKDDDIHSFTDYSEAAKLNYPSGYYESSAEEDLSNPTPLDRPRSLKVAIKPFESEPSASKFIDSKANLQNPPAESNKVSYSDSDESYESEEEASIANGRNQTSGRSDSENYEDSDLSIEEYSENEG